MGGSRGEGPAFPSVSSVLKDVGNGGLIFMKFVFEWRRKRVIMGGRDEKRLESIKERRSWRSVPRRVGGLGPEPTRLFLVFQGLAHY